jgi:hypothetical protein
MIYYLQKIFVAQHSTLRLKVRQGALGAKGGAFASPVRKIHGFFFFLP